MFFDIKSKQPSQHTDNKIVTKQLKEISTKHQLVIYQQLTIHFANNHYKTKTKKKQICCYLILKSGVVDNLILYRSYTKVAIYII